MLGEIIGIVVDALSPVDEELAVLDAIFDPVEMHVDGFGATLFYFVIGDAGGNGIVSLDRGCRLWVPHFG